MSIRSHRNRLPRSIFVLFLLVVSVGVWCRLLPAQTNDDSRTTSDRRTGSAGASNSGSGTPGASGGGVEADFDALIALIESIEPESWEALGGPGTIQEFEGGVFVDASGVMRRVDDKLGKSLAERFRMANQRLRGKDDPDVLTRSDLRKVSLNRLEREIERRAAMGLRPSDTMRRLAGLERIDYLVIDDATGDVILAGPAGSWFRDDQGRIVSEHTRRPILDLDDLVVVLRNVFSSGGQFSCSITPQQENLVSAKEYIDRTTQRPLQPGQRGAWLRGLQESLGNQRIDIRGVPTGSRLARVIVEADYHMKRVGIGLEPGTDGVVSYLDSIEIPKGASPPPLGVLRWWFTPSTEAILANSARDTFALTSHSVRVQSEKEFLTDQGQLVHIGESDELSSQFAKSFTSHFDALAKRYVVFADLENIFELALVAAILHGEDVPSRTNWSMRFFLGPEYQIEQSRTAKEVPSVINHRVIHRKHVVAAVSGGVTVHATKWASKQIRTSSPGTLKVPGSVPTEAKADQWWWD